MAKVPDMRNHGRPPRPAIVHLEGEHKLRFIDRARAQLAKLKEGMGG